MSDFDPSKRRWEYGRAPRTLAGQPSGSLDVPIQVAGTLPGAWTQLAALNTKTPQPVVLEVVTTATSSTLTIGSMFAAGEYQPNIYVSPFTLNPNAWISHSQQGALRVTYGTQGCLQTRIIDPRGGSYQLPPCTSVTVEARAYNVSAVDAPYPWRCTVSLSVGETQDPDVPVASGVREIVGGAQAAALPFQGLRFWRFAPLLDGANQVADFQLVVQQVQPPLAIDMSVLPYPNSGIVDLVQASTAPLGAVGIQTSGADTLDVFMQQVLAW